MRVPVTSGAALVALVAMSAAAVAALLISASAAAAPVVTATPNFDYRRLGRPDAMVRNDADGKLYVTGGFTRASSTAGDLGPLQRLNADGSVDVAWNPHAQSLWSANALLLDAAAHLYVGGGPITFNGSARSGLARLSASTAALDASWTPQRTGTVYALALDAAGNLVVAGDSGTLSAASGPSVTGYLARVAPAGTIDGTWLPALTGSARALAVASNGTDVFVGGRCIATLAAACRNVVKVTAAGAIDATWLSPDACYEVVALVATGDGSLYVGCTPQSTAQPASVLKLAQATASVAWSWPASASPGQLGYAQALLALSDGKVYVAGSLWCSGTSCPLVRLAQDTGALDAAWPGATTAYHVVAMARRGGTHIALLSDDGYVIDAQTTVPANYAPLTTFDIAADVFELACDPYGGRALLLGSFDFVSGATRPRAALLAADGSVANWPVAATLAPQRIAGTNRAAAFDADGSFVIAYNERIYVPGAGYRDMVRYTGSPPQPDTAWNPPANPQGTSTVYALGIDAAHRVYAAGANLANTGRTLQRYLANGSVDAWDPPVTAVRRLLVAPAQQRVHVLDNVAGKNRLRTFALQGATEIAPTFPDDAHFGADSVYDLALDGSGGLYVYGGSCSGPTCGFQAYTGRPILRLSASGTPDPAWLGPAAPSASVFNAWRRIELAGSRWLYLLDLATPSPRLRRYAASGSGGADAYAGVPGGLNAASLAGLCTTRDRVYVGGNLTSLDGVPRYGAAALSDDDPALNDVIFYNRFE